VLHLTSVHRPRDVRIFHKEVASLRAAGADARVLALPEPARRAKRLALGWRLAREARRRDADIYHVHDPELIPAALWLSRASGRPVVYDVHEYLGQTVRTKPWLPAPVRVPLAWGVERLERAGARRLAGAVAEGARLVLVGPGDPGDLPERVEHLGAVDHSEVAGLLSRSAVAWVPLQRHGNYDRAVPTKLVEAMAAGRPVVASDLPRMAAMVRSTGCGIVVPADDPDAHAAALTRLLDDPEEAAALGAAGRRAFEERLSFDAQAAALTGLYAAILDDR
jgi:glycosyltransferase involved in cell wall biosynthesis